MFALNGHRIEGSSGREHGPRLRLQALLVCIAAMMLMALSASAHGDEPPDPSDLWTDWAFEPLVVLSLAITGWIYLRGLRRLWRNAGVGVGIRKWEAAAGACGWLGLVVALVSPLHPLGRVLFSAHMTQHELLMLAAAPLLVLGRPAIVSTWGLPFEWRKRVGELTRAAGWRALWRAATNPLAAWAIHAVALWIWHVPSLFQATLNNEVLHAVQHLSFLLSAVLFWWALIHGRGLMGYGAGVLYVFTTSIHSGVLGALLTFSRSLWYPAYGDKANAWGLTNFEDQQLGGLIMWIPAGLVYVVAGLALFVGWLRESERRVQLGSTSADVDPGSYSRKSEAFL